MDYAALGQTILWVSLIVWIVRKFNPHILGLLTVLQKRIEEGSSIKFGMLEVAAPSQQQQKASIEIAETSESALPQTSGGPSQESSSVGDSSKSARQRYYFQAEDLALRAIQAEEGQPIIRQVGFHGDSRAGFFDGAYEANGVFNVVEVKYVPHRGKTPNIRAALGSIIAALKRNASGRKAKVILAVVFEGQPEAQVIVDLHNLSTGLEYPVVVRTFTLGELQRRFGIADGAALLPSDD